MGIFNVKQNIDKKSKELSADIGENLLLLQATMELMIDFIPELRKGSPDRLRDFLRLIDIGTEQASILANNRRVYFENTNFQRWFRYWENDIEYSATGTKNFMNGLGKQVGKFDMLLNEISNLTSKTGQGKLKKSRKTTKKSQPKKSQAKKKARKVVKKVAAKKKAKSTKKRK
jgi:hypothetical protein